MASLKPAWRERFERALEERQLAGNLRQLRPASTRVDFCSNDYLGLARTDLLVEQAPARAGATGSRLITGNYPAIELLEGQLATYHGAESGLIFGSGYTANIGLLTCVARRGDTLLYDQLCHASLRDGLQLSPARTLGFRHNDLDELEAKLRRSGGQRFVVVESIYSMDGDAAPLVDLTSLCTRYDAALIVDEAHAVGVFGARGEGLVSALGLEAAVWARIVTFGKALGGHGAIVLGPRYLRDFLINFCRPFIYTTAPPPLSIQHLGLAYRELERGTQLAALRGVLAHWEEQIVKRFPHFGVLLGSSAIRVWPVPGNERAKALAASIRQAGFEVKAILHPTVARGSERIRICLHAFNTFAEMEALLQLLNRESEKNNYEFTRT
ncbi:MAG: 8-amino-7-oxononanoate synthase [Bacteroidota bacterium]